MAALLPAIAPAAEARDLAVVYPPWWSAQQSLGAAGRTARILRPGSEPFIVIVRAEGPHAREKLQDGGAVLLLNPMAGACGEPRTT